MTRKPQASTPGAREAAYETDRMASELLAPVEAEMLSLRMTPAQRAVMWEAIGRKALARAKEAAKG